MEFIHKFLAGFARLCRPSSSHNGRHRSDVKPFEADQGDLMIHHSNVESAASQNGPILLEPFLPHERHPAQHSASSIQSNGFKDVSSQRPFVKTTTKNTTPTRAIPFDDLISKADQDYPDMATLENREVHERFMREAIAMGEKALTSDETPVGCVFVRNGEIIGHGMNDTNKSMNGTRHAEFVGLSEIMSKYPPTVLQETDLYVTVEPCIMCASALRQLKIRAVYFGCFNDRFGGTGGVLNIHSDPSIDPPYPAYGGIFREEAIMLLRRFYIQENDKAPEPKQKRNRELKTDIVPLDTTRHAVGKENAPPKKASSAPTANKENALPFRNGVPK